MNMRDIKAIIFDADNTLYETRKIAMSADMAALQTASRITHRDIDTLYDAWMSIVKVAKSSMNPDARTRWHSYKLLLEKLGIEDMAVLEAMYTRFEQFLMESMPSVVTPNAASTLEALKKDYQLFVVSEDEKNLLEKKMKVLGWDKYFTLVISSHDAGTMKPSRKYYDLLKEKTNIDFRNFAVVGDTLEKDLKIPKELGMKTILFGRGGGADASIIDLSQLPEVLKRL